MSKLDPLRFNRIGALTFDADGIYSYVGDMMKIDRGINRMFGNCSYHQAV